MEPFIMIGNKHKKNSGFTLTELLVVLAIIGLLAALVGPMLYQRINPAKQATARAQIENFSTALDGFFIDVGRYPNNTEALQALRDAPDGLANWHGPYLKKAIPDDPWGRAYVYRSPGRSGGYEIMSYGVDGKEGGDEEGKDIASWE